MGPNEELVICDTGNDRILLVDPESGEKLGVIGAQNRVTQLNFPTSVAINGPNIIVADSGNNRVRYFAIQTTAILRRFFPDQNLQFERRSAARIRVFRQESRPV